MTAMTDKARRLAEIVASYGGKAYYVGGFVRDRLLDLPAEDVDIEVHGIEADLLRDILGRIGDVKTVGKSFGIYSVHGMEVALPRKEESTGTGHRDFEIYTDPLIGEERAALRRDFTINALMEDILTGQILDFYGGREDLEKNIIRHIDDRKFVEDPLRALRGAGLASRLEFHVADETVELCRTMDIRDISSQRIEEELYKGLCLGKKPSLFFETLRNMELLDYWFKEVKELIGIQQDRVHHPEGDVWNHTMEVIDRGAKYRSRSSNPKAFMLLCLTHDMGKVLTTEEVDGRIHAYGHEKEGLQAVEAFLDRIVSCRKTREYVLNMTALHMKPNIVAGCGAGMKTTNRLFDEAASPEDLVWFSIVDRGDCPDEEDSKVRFLRDRLEVYRRIMAGPFISGGDLLEEGFSPGRELGEMLSYAHKLRLGGIGREEALRQTVGYGRRLIKERNFCEKSQRT